MTEEEVVGMEDELEQSAEEALDEILAELGCPSFHRCKGRKLEIVKKLYERGYSIEDISQAIEISPNAVKAMLAKSGVDFSGKGEATDGVDRSSGDEAAVSDGITAEFEEEELETDFGFTIKSPYSEYIPSVIRVRGEKYSPEELVSEYGTNGLRLIKIIALSRVLTHGTAFRKPPKKFIKQINQTLFMNNKIVDDTYVVASILNRYRIDPLLVDLALSVLNYIDQQYKSLADIADRSVPPMTWTGVEKDGVMTFFPVVTSYNQPVNPINTYSVNPVIPANPVAQYPVNPAVNPVNTYPVTYPITNPATNPMTNPVTPDYPIEHPQRGEIDKLLEEIKERDKVIEELKGAVEALLEEKRKKEEEDREKERLKAIADLIESKITPISSRIAMLEDRISGGVENKEKDVLLETINTLRDELKTLKEEMTKKEIESLKNMIATLEKRLENPFPTSLNQYMVEYLTKKLEAEAEITKAQEQTKTLERVFDRLKDTFTSAADVFGRAIGKSVASPPVETICPFCGTHFTFNKMSRVVRCPACGRVVYKHEEKTGTVQQGKQEQGEAVKQETSTQESTQNETDENEKELDEEL